MLLLIWSTQLTNIDCPPSGSHTVRDPLAQMPQTRVIEPGLTPRIISLQLDILLLLPVQKLHGGPLKVLAVAPIKPGTLNVEHDTITDNLPLSDVLGNSP